MTRILEAIAVTLLVLAVLLVSSPTAMTPASSAISINTNRVLTWVPPNAVGVDTSVGDKHLLDRSVPGLLRDAGIGILRFPAGMTADLYHWRTHTTTPGWLAYTWPSNTVDNLYWKLAMPSTASQFVTVNYGSNSRGTGGGDPSEAAAWVRYANKIRHFQVKYWEIGNEVYGNGYYFYDWETDLHTRVRGPRRIGNPALSPSAYARNALAYVRAMKREDRSIKVGVELVTPGRYPDSLSNVDGQGVQNWNPTVLSIACRSIDFVTISWYAQHTGHESDAGLLSAVDQIPGVVRDIRYLLQRYCGSKGSRIGIVVTETNSVNANPGKQTLSPVNGLFLVEDFLSWLQAGAQSVFWWEVHWHPNYRANNSRSLSGRTRYGDYGLLSSGIGGEPRVNAPFPSYSALRLLRQALPVGARFVDTSSSLSGVRAWALRDSSGHLMLVLLNTTTSRAYTIAPTMTGFIPHSGKVVRFSFRAPWPTVSTLTIKNGAFNYRLNPYSAVVIKLTGAFTGSQKR